MREAIPHEVCFTDSESLADHLDVFHGKNFVHFISRFVSDELELELELNRTEQNLRLHTAEHTHAPHTHHTPHTDQTHRAHTARNCKLMFGQRVSKIQESRVRVLSCHQLRHMCGVAGVAFLRFFQECKIFK